MPIAKQQHYVPQRSLLRWSSDNRRVWVFDKQTDRSFVNQIDKTACQAYFYEMGNQSEVGTAEHFQTAEKMLVKIEGFGQRAIESVLDATRYFRVSGTKTKRSAKRVIFSEDRKSLALFLAIQHLRTPSSRRSTVNFNRALLKAMVLMKLENTELDLSDKDFDVQLSREATVGSHVITMFRGGMQASHILRRRLWLFGANTTETSFIIGDNPVLVLPSESPNPMFGHGFCSPDVEVSLPLSPDLYLSLTYFRPSNRIDSKLDGHCIVIDGEAVSRFNRAQVRFSDRFLYGREDNFDWVRELLREQPEWRRPRKRDSHVVAGPYAAQVNSIFDENANFDHCLRW
jgi:hypothetical protein